MECPEVKAAWFNAYVALLKACYSTDPEVTALAACRAIVAASDNGMTADEARAAVEMCRAAVAKAEGAGTGGEFPACALKGGR